MMKTNYQLETDKTLAALPAGERPRLLLHSCCGPCSSYVLEYLTQYFNVTVLYYNPNIQPEAEYEKRLFYQREVLRHIPAAILECTYDGAAFEAAAAGYEDAPAAFCCAWRRRPGSPRPTASTISARR